MCEENKECCENASSEDQNRVCEREQGDPCDGIGCDGRTCACGCDERHGCGHDADDVACEEVDHDIETCGCDGCDGCGCGHRCCGGCHDCGCGCDGQNGEESDEEACCSGCRMKTEIVKIALEVAKSIAVTAAATTTALIVTSVLKKFIKL